MEPWFTFSLVFPVWKVFYTPYVHPLIKGCHFHFIYVAKQFPHSLTVSLWHGMAMNPVSSAGLSCFSYLAWPCHTGAISLLFCKGEGLNRSPRPNVSAEGTDSGSWIIGLIWIAWLLQFKFSFAVEYMHSLKHKYMHTFNTWKSILHFPKIANRISKLHL